MAQLYKINGSTNGFENKDIASFKAKFYNCEKIIGLFDSGVEKLAAQNVASQGPVHDCTCMYISMRDVYWAEKPLTPNSYASEDHRS